MFVRRTTVRGKTYHYLVECVRVTGGKSRQRTLCNLGEFPGVDEALRGLPALIAGRRINAAYWRAKMEECEREYYRRGGTGEIPRPTRSGSASVNKLLRRYWNARESSERYEQLAAEAKARLVQLRQVRSICKATGRKSRLVAS